MRRPSTKAAMAALGGVELVRQPKSAASLAALAKYRVTRPNVPHAGQFRKGDGRQRGKGGGGVKGGSHAAMTLVMLAREFTVEAMLNIVAIMREAALLQPETTNGKIQSWRVVMEAAQILMDRGWGKPPMAVMLGAPGSSASTEEPTGQARALTDDEKIEWATQVVDLLRSVGRLPKDDTPVAVKVED